MRDCKFRNVEEERGVKGRCINGARQRVALISHGAKEAPSWESDRPLVGSGRSARIGVALATALYSGGGHVLPGNRRS